MTLFLASALPAVVVALLGWGVAAWARASASKAEARPVEDRYGAWES